MLIMLFIVDIFPGSKLRDLNDSCYNDYCVAISNNHLNKATLPSLVEKIDSTDRLFFGGHILQIMAQLCPPPLPH